MVLSGCAEDARVEPLPPPPFPYPLMAPIAPPVPQVEEIAPSIGMPPDQIWIPGVWEFQGARFVWRPGRVVPRPSSTAVWTADRWDRLTYGWVFVPGHWQ